ncbi:Gfo/Idh/MocA family protein [Paenibacillus monticola]|uniref:Gfo/Idh/MocA family oxidoreductase n=1 Tax=Paenibacillus monticola TaxID=2666075 RepID=A0A7X2H0X2_9BACL|nr:Gfo/Idh/MocA family oxidoreductase [Paenibacillus monticola]MRN51536.1 gfo/Idh/MocA family oxidoreductase [Paenibacillus monticola]
MEKIVFGLLGGGWRAEFYLRIAKALPEQFAVAAMYVRNTDKAESLRKTWGVAVYSTLEEFIAAGGYSFAVVSLKREVSKDYIIKLCRAGIPVLAETPPAEDLEQLTELWNQISTSAIVQIAEQYLFQPMHAARIRLARSGVLGEISQAQVSAAHGYHGISLMRQLLGIGYQNVTIRGQKFQSPIVNGPQRSGPPTLERRVQSEQIIATFDFGDKLGLFDFVGDQYFSWIRGNRILVRGDRGEIIGNEISWLQSYDTPLYSTLRRVDAGHGGNLEGFYLKGIMGDGEWLYRNPFTPARLSEDEIAIAESLLRMGQHVQGGPSFYSLAEGSQDQYLALLLEQSVNTGEVIISESQPWSKGK